MYGRLHYNPKSLLENRRIFAVQSRTCSLLVLIKYIYIASVQRLCFDRIIYLLTCTSLRVMDSNLSKTRRKSFLENGKPGVCDEGLAGINRPRDSTVVTARFRAGYVAGLGQSVHLPRGTAMQPCQVMGI